MDRKNNFPWGLKFSLFCTHTSNEIFQLAKNYLQTKLELIHIQPIYISHAGFALARLAWRSPNPFEIPPNQVVTKFI